MRILISGKSLFFFLFEPWSDNPLGYWVDPKHRDAPENTRESKKTIRNEERERSLNRHSSIANRRRSPSRSGIRSWNLRITVPMLHQPGLISECGVRARGIFALSPDLTGVVYTKVTLEHPHNFSPRNVHPRNERAIGFRGKLSGHSLHRLRISALTGAIVCCGN